MMNPKTAAVPTVQWLPAERLGERPLDPALRVWLIGKGLLTERLKAASQNRFTLSLVEQNTALLPKPVQSALGVSDAAGLLRDVEMRGAGVLWVYARTVVPDSTLSAHPWLAELGDAALGETLSALSGVERGPYEYAWLPPEEPLAARAREASGSHDGGLWSRRSRFTIRGAPLLVHELFFPAVAAGHPASRRV